jgi:hypothetical protein
MVNLSWSTRAALASLALVGSAFVVTLLRSASGPEQQENEVFAASVFHDSEDAMLHMSGSSLENIFGLVGDVGIGQDGRSYVLDVLERNVAVFTASGDREAVLGGPGQGPGEFMGPVALAVDGVHGGVYVMDERNQRIEVFAGAEPAWERSFRIDFHGRDLCFLGGRLYVLGPRRGFLLHELSPVDGAVLRSFAPDAESEDILLASYRADGYLGCAASGELTFLPMLRPDVVRFDAASGKELGSIAVPDYRAVRVAPTADGGMKFDVPGGGGHDYASAILPLPAGGWLIQVGRLRPRPTNAHEFQSIRSYVVSADGARVRPSSLALPRLMATRGDSAFAVETSPYPAVRIISAPSEE